MRMSPIRWAVPIVSLGALVTLSGVAPVSAQDAAQPARSPYGPVSYPGLLQSVSAVSASDVWAVGFHDDDQQVSSPLIEHWNGHFWSLQASARLGGGGGSALYGVSGVAAQDVWAVGSTFTGTEFDTLVQHWDGVSWTQVPSPSPGGASGSFLTAVSMRSATDGWAVGHTYDGPLILHWDGSTWGVVESPGGVGVQLSSVSAVSATDAYAAGNTFGAFSRAFLLHWNGHRWSRMANARSAKIGHGDRVTGISATTDATAWAVGTTTSYRHVVDRSLIQRWDGIRWQQVAGLDPGGRFGTRLTGVAAVADDDVWAVGSYGVARGGPDRTFIEHWTGSRWKLTHSASPGGRRSSEVAGVAALDASHAWAVGSYLTTTEMTMTQNRIDGRWIQL